MSDDKGDMALHARRVAAEVGAQGELVERVAERARERLAEEVRREEAAR